MKVTLHSIAKDTGLSVSTVSRVLRGETKAGGQNERLVLESAQRLNYPMQKQRTPVDLRREIFIAVLTHLYEGEFFASFFQGFHEASKGTNVRFGLFSVADIDVPVNAFIRDLNRTFDAAVLFLPELDAEQYREILQVLPPDFPVISTATILNPVFDTITFDAYSGGHLVADHFFHRGYKNVGIIHGPQTKLEARFRSNGFVDSVKNRPGVELIWEFHGDYSVESGQEAYQAYAAATSRPRAIFSANDTMLLGFIELARADGIRVPEDLAIAGYDNLPMCRMHYPQITSIFTDYKKLGQRVMQLLVSQLESPSPHHGVLSLIPVSLEVRESA